MSGACFALWIAGLACSAGQELEHESFGHALLAMPDLDGDGVADLVVGAPLERRGARLGVVRALSGATGATLYELCGADGSGDTLARLGDVDADGVEDFAVGSRGREGRSGYSVRSGKDGRALHGESGHGGGGPCVVASTGDLDGDSIAELVVGWPGSNVDGEERVPSVVEVLSGASGEVVRSIASDRVRADVPAGRKQIGRRVWGLPDLDGDGLAELAFTCHTGLEWGAPASIVAVSGSGELLWRIAPSRPSSGDGPALVPIVPRAGAATLLLVGSSEWNGAAIDEEDPEPVWIEPLGEVSCFDAAGAGADWPGAGPLVGPSPRFGHALAAGADLDGDGVGDLLVTEHEQVSMGVVGGRCLVYSGATREVLREHTGAPFSGYGASVALLGDVDGDGVADYAVGCEDDDPGARSAGAVFVHSGRSGDELYRLPGR